MNDDRYLRTTGEAEAARDARVRALRFIFQCYEKHKAAEERGSMDDPKGANNDRVKRILPP